MNAISLQPHLWTREEYERMVSAGVFHPEDRLELINGAILEMTPQSRAHATAVCLVDEVLSAVYAQGFTVRVQVPMALGESSEPEPDVAIVRGRPRDYLASHPTVAVLVVEISDSSLRYDREYKQGLYAASGTPEYWILNLIDYRLEVYRDPDQERETYRSCTVLIRNDTVSPLARPDASISVADLLP